MTEPDKSGHKEDAAHAARREARRVQATELLKRISIAIGVPVERFLTASRRTLKSTDGL